MFSKKSANQSREFKLFRNFVTNLKSSSFKKISTKIPVKIENVLAFDLWANNWRIFAERFTEIPKSEAKLSVLSGQKIHGTSQTF
jgi:hypothetical protein